ncbi:hypothetical protein ASD79_06680 [Caulobacter sp. Root655]|uniref:hypothetical protein n=1 Tax=Caulobacter sp. Root655 TaxID=1736578 RepID=UPI0006F648CA|nr:hypothetical protein [Caulobacter sp. Root655]KRA61789.1 hypothetical protein ASD79_06680 [Caulobacter sp. Root655]
MFEDDEIEIYAINEVPMDRDIYLMDEIWMAQYAEALRTCLSGGRYENVGYISYAAARSATPAGVELSWYPNIHTRFHEMRVYLPTSAFVMCVGCQTIDEKPRIFVKSDWLQALHLRSNCAFALVDAIGVKAALADGCLTADRLADLAARIDAIAADHPTIAFVSFADSLLLKSHWSVGTWDSEVNYTYEPEQILRVLPLIADAYSDVLGLKIYAVATQGQNAFFHDQLMHVSVSGNHVSLNSLGLPFAQLQAIEAAARTSIRNGEHAPADLYLDRDFYNSLNWCHGFEKQLEPRSHYLAPMASTPCTYIPISLRRVLDNLKPPRTKQSS